MKVLNFDSGLCERTRRQLDAYLSNELMVETTSEVVRHLDGCESCAHELDTRLRVRDALRKAIAHEAPPEHLQQATHQRLRHAQPALLAGFRTTTWSWAVAALALVIITGTVGQQGLKLRQGRATIASVLALGASDHVDCALRGHNYPDLARSQDDLERRLGPECAGLLPIVQQRLTGFQVLEAHTCSLPGSARKYVHLIARGEGTLLSVILTKREGQSLPQERLLVADSSAKLYQARLRGMNVAGFQSNQYFGFVVSDLGQDRTLQIARALAPPIRDTLDRSQVQQSFGDGYPIWAKES